MFYFEGNKNYLAVIPTIAFSIKGEFWIDFNWLNFAFGWRSGNEWSYK